MTLLQNRENVRVALNRAILIVFYPDAGST